MQESVYFNNEIITAQDSSVGALSSAALYSKGIFTTIAVYDGNPFLWGKHWRRLSGNADKLKIDLAEFSESETRKARDEIIQTNEPELSIKK